MNKSYNRAILQSTSCNRRSVWRIDKFNWIWSKWVVQKSSQLIEFFMQICKKWKTVWKPNFRLVMSNNQLFFVKSLHLFESVLRKVAPMPCIFRICPGGYLLFIFCMIVCLRQIKESYFMDGVPIQRTMVLTKKSFYAAGRLMALSLI